MFRSLTSPGSTTMTCGSRSCRQAPNYEGHRKLRNREWQSSCFGPIGLQLPADGRKRVVIEDVKPEIDGGRFAIKRTVGQAVRVGAAVFADGHDLISCQVLYRLAAD